MLELFENSVCEESWQGSGSRYSEAFPGLSLSVSARIGIFESRFILMNTTDVGKTGSLFDDCMILMTASGSCRFS